MADKAKGIQEPEVGCTPSALGTKDLSCQNAVLGAPPQPVQQPLFHVEKQTEIDGIEMGVLENGIPYLSESGLARMCGISRPVLNRLAVGWQDEKSKPRGKQILEMLERVGYTEQALFLESELGSTKINAYTEPVCLALLEYYAFVVDEPRPEAQRAFRTLARTTFRKFIYDCVGYSPDQRILDDWRHFHDRVSLTSQAVPMGYWCVFQEIAGMIVPMINSGLMISDKVIPDISVGKAWSKFWDENNMPAQHGDRIRFDHSYPDYYPQAKSNPQPAFAYPDTALADFRYWLRQNYIVNKFPSYLLGQVGKGYLKLHTVNQALSSLGVKEIEQRTKRTLKG